MPVTKKPHMLIHPWTSYEAMSRDVGTGGAGDGELTLFELQSHIDRLSVQRAELLADHSSTAGVDLRIKDARRLYKDMVDSGAASLQYLPDHLMSLPSNLRQRASELLLHDDVGSLGDIDQFVLDHARERYAVMTGSAATFLARDRAMIEIDALAAALGYS
jgi:hypothetical protein